MTSFKLTENQTLFLVLAPVWCQLSLYTILTVLQSFASESAADRDKMLLPFQRIIWYLNGSCVGFEALFTFFILYDFFTVNNNLPWEILAIVLTSYKYLLDIFISFTMFNSCSGFRGQRRALLLAFVCFLLYPIGGIITLSDTQGKEENQEAYNAKLQVTAGVFHTFQTAVYTTLLLVTLYKDNIFFMMKLSPFARRRQARLYLVNQLLVSIGKAATIFLIRYKVWTQPMIYGYAAVNWWSYCVTICLLYLTLGWDAEYWRAQNRSMHRSLSTILGRSRHSFQMSCADLNEPLLGQRPDEFSLLMTRNSSRESPPTMGSEETNISRADSVKMDTNVFFASSDFNIPDLPYYYENAMFCFLPGVLGIRASRGQSAYARVFRGTFRRKEVAIKKQFCEHLDHDVIARFRTEILMWKRLTHKNIVRCVGGSIEPPNLFVIMELCERGSLLNLLRKHRTIDWLQKCRYALDVARGLEHLHGLSPPILHRDIRLANIVVSKSGIAKITDFGTASVDRSALGQRGKGGAAWMAPEVLAASMYSKKSDVYSFGVMMWELFTHGIEPYSVREKVRIRYASKAEIIEAVVTGGLRPYMPIEAPDTIQSLMKECWQTDPEKRPDFTRVCEVLDACWLVLKTWYDQYERNEEECTETGSTHRSASSRQVESREHD